MLCSVLADENACLDCLACGGLVIVPTETFYAISCRIDQNQALESIVRIKERDQNKPLPLACGSIAQMAEVVEPRFWQALVACGQALFHLLPGPLTLVLPVKDPSAWHPTLLNSRSELAIRVSSHPLVRDLSCQAQSILTVSSANLAHHSPVQAHDQLDPVFVQKLAKASVPVLIHPSIDRPSYPLPSTIVRPHLNPLRLELVRPGAISTQELKAAGLIIFGDECH